MNRRLRLAVFQRDRYRCVYCGRSSAETVLEADHVVPRALGGLDVSTNLVTACRDCNGAKSDLRIALPDYFVPEPVGFQRRYPMPYGLAPIPQGWMRWCAYPCRPCLGISVVRDQAAAFMPTAFLDGDAHSIRLGYECRMAHRWAVHWDPAIAEIHARTIKQALRWLQ